MTSYGYLMTKYGYLRLINSRKILQIDEKTYFLNVWIVGIGEHRGGRFSSGGGAGEGERGQEAGGIQALYQVGSRGYTGTLSGREQGVYRHFIREGAGGIQALYQGGSRGYTGTLSGRGQGVYTHFIR